MIFKRATGMSLPPVGMIFSILRDPLGTVEAIFDSIVNPRVSNSLPWDGTQREWRDYIDVSSDLTEIVASLNRIFETEGGQELLEEAEKRGRTTTISVNQEGLNQTSPDGRSVTIDPGKRELTLRKGILFVWPASLDETIAHELAHALADAPNDVFSMEVIDWENKISRQLGGWGNRTCIPVGDRFAC
jgi:hypothetical protein